MECDSNFSDPWCFCFNKNNVSMPEYKQYNADGQDVGSGFHCCHITHFTPSFLAYNLPTHGYINTVVEYLNLLNSTPSTGSGAIICDYGKYTNNFTDTDVVFKNNYPELYQNARMERDIFNSFFQKDNSIHKGLIVSNQELIPSLGSDNTVTCPVPNYVPYFFSYNENDLEKKRYQYVCHPEKTPFPSLSNMNYNTLYFYDVNGNNCKTNTCALSYNSSFGINAGDRAHENNNTTKFTTGRILAISISAAVFMISIIAIIYYANQHGKK